jgi:MoaA/NifB/PqqE/SkfB family radical SAM enzyme
MGTDRVDLARGVMRGWGKILAGRFPSLSIEITRECPLRCPGCYAYGDEHLGGGVTLRELRDLKGEALVDGVVDLVKRHKPLHVSIIGGEPLVRYRELDAILPKLEAMNVHTQVVTSAVRPIPDGWRRIKHLNITVSIDGLQPEHDERRKPATYDRILKHIAGHTITVHCTVTRQQVRREGYIEEFVRFWSDQSTTKRIWISLYTPQIGEMSDERLTPADRELVIADLMRLRTRYPKLDMPAGLIAAYAKPPTDPASCTFARTTACYSADLTSQVTPCQFGGHPDCSNCGCVASGALEAVARHTLPGGIRVGAIYEASVRVGEAVRRARGLAWSVPGGHVDLSQAE